MRELQIYVDPHTYFKVGVRDIWKEVTVTHQTKKEADKWLAAPCYDYWPQQLNFAVWCATAGCGVSITDPAVKTFPPIVQGLLHFHVYFTTRRILYELGCPLPGDSAFTQMSNPYRKPAFGAHCVEFGLSRAPDFRWRGGSNGGLGNIFIPGGRGGTYQKTQEKWPLQPAAVIFFDKLAFLRNDDHGGTQYSWFCPKKGEGLTEAGMGRLGRSIEAFVYCVLGAQAKARSTIVGTSSSAVNARQMFPRLLEEAITVSDIPTAMRNYQQALADVNARLDFAVAPGLLLLPSQLVLNMGSVVRYNNEIQIASPEMGFGVQPRINEATHHAHSPGSGGHKSTPLAPPHQTSSGATKTSTQVGHRPRGSGGHSAHRHGDSSLSAHEKNLAALTVATAAAAWWMFR